MMKFLILSLCLTFSSAFSLVQNLYSIEKQCYAGCQSNYFDAYANLEACKTGCDYKLHGENCAKQCKLLSIHEQIQASCVDGCAMSRPVSQEKKQSVVMIPVQILKNLLEKLKEKTESHIRSVIILVKKPQNHQQIDHVHEYMHNVPEKFHQIIETQSKIPIIIFSTVLVILLILLTASIISICRKTVKRSDLSISTQELIFDHHHQSPTPVKVKLDI